MKFVRETVKESAIGVGIADDSAALSTFLQPGCAAAIWRRQTPPKVQSWLDGVDADVLPRARVVLPPRAVGEVIQNLFDMAGLPFGPEREWLQKDIVGLADMFSDLLQAKYLRLRLDVVTTNACRRFHIDAITARLICTYRGTGTQYGISTDGADRNACSRFKPARPYFCAARFGPANRLPVCCIVHPQ